MKTKLKIGVIMIAVLLSVYIQIKNENKHNELFLENVEALANGESGSIYCIYVGSVVCPDTHVKVYKTY